MEDIKLIIAKILATLTGLFLIFLLFFPVLWKDYEKKLEMDKDIPAIKPIPDPIPEPEPMPEPEPEPEIEIIYLKDLVLNEGDELDGKNGVLINLGDYGVRYQGSNPDNYVYFNCTDYENQTKETCEIWRIIGIVDGKMKLIKNESIGKYSWDLKQNIYKNDWATSSLNTYLNGEYLNEFTNETLNMINNATWYLKGYNSNKVTKDVMYDLERTNGLVYNTNTEIIENTKVGLIYPSDFAYAALENNTCSSTTLLSNYSVCIDNWLSRDTDAIFPNSWLLSHWSGGNAYVFVASQGLIGGSEASRQFDVKPSVYLNENVGFIDGNGTSINPYQLIETTSKN